MIRGKVRGDLNMELRVRFISGYNFIIVAKGSPYISDKFCRLSKDYLDGILKNTTDPNDFFEFLKGFKI